MKYSQSGLSQPRTRPLFPPPAMIAPFPFASIPTAADRPVSAPPAAHPMCIGPLPIGGLTVVWGPAGCGKTRLLRRIAHILADDEPATRTILADRQAASVASLRVFEALLLAHKQGDRWAVGAHEIQAVGASLEQVGLTQAAGKLVADLAGDAHYRLRLAQALIRRPDVLLLDEPGPALPLAAQADIAALLKRAAAEQGMRAVIAMADLHTALQVADKLLVLRQGRLVAIGTPDELRDPLRAGRIDMTPAPP